MLTRAGWLVGAGAAALLVTGRFLGVIELYFVAAAGLALLGVCALLVARPTPGLALHRAVVPPRVHAGTPSRVQVRAANGGARRTPVVELHDPVSGTGGADLLLVPLDPARTATAAYQLPTERRGIIRIGPMTTSRTDPFGLTRRTDVAVDATELTVLPRVDAIAPLPLTLGNDPLAGADHPNALGRSGEDFYALRQYVVGDDLRRVHWPSTARTGDLMVRQDELPWQGRTTVLLDVRRGATTADSLEQLVSAAASVTTACWHRRDLVRLVSTDGTDTGFAAGHAHIDAIMEYLAVVQPSDRSTLRRSLATVRDTGGALVALVAQAPQSDLDAISSLAEQVGALTVVHIGAGAAADGGRTRRVRAASPSLRVITVRPGGSFAEAWNARFLPSTRRTLRRAPVGRPR